MGYKIKAQFHTRLTECGSDYHGDPKFELEFHNTKGDTCTKFTAAADDLVRWSKLYLGECAKPPPKPGKKSKTIKSYSASIEKKFKRVVAAYIGGAENQPEPMC